MRNFKTKALRVTGVGYQAFKDCTKLTDLNYKGIPCQSGQMSLRVLPGNQDHYSLWLTLQMEIFQYDER